MDQKLLFIYLTLYKCFHSTYTYISFHFIYCHHVLLLKHFNVVWYFLPFQKKKSNNNNKKFLLRSTEKIDRRRIIARYTSSLLPSFFSSYVVLSVITNLYAFNSPLVFTYFLYISALLYCPFCCVSLSFSLSLHLRLTHSKK